MALSPDQMARMAALLEQALELDREGRERWLKALRSEDQDLEPVLRHSLLAGEVAPLTMPRLPDATQLKPGDAVGPYRLMRPLGSGGMAEVWLAQRADGAFKREVALKLPTLWRDRADLSERFARETEILAQLEHPRIARLYDAGVTQAGLPYLAMEYVQGEPISASSQRLNLGGRLRLFLQVLEAVQYAHDKGVVHRDIKPSNILITNDGQVRLLDFGVAKLLEQPETRQLTEVYGRALTPQYASPELLKGGAVNAAADVYALGVLLYELLAGERPYELKPSSVDDLQQALATVEIPPPSIKRAELKGDLDAIVLKALSTDPGQRYASAQAFAEDLQRSLGRRPVSARPPTPAYRLELFARRNTTLLGTTAGFLLVAGIAVAGWLHKAPAPPIATAPVAPEKSIVVLPFVDMSEKHDQEYFSDGLSEELIDKLTKVRDLRVPARTSSFYFKGKQTTIADVAKALGVAHVLEGSVRKSGNQLRITAQLIRVTDGYHVWSQTYDRKLDDVFRIQDEIATAVVSALKSSLAGSAGQSMSTTQNSAAFALYLQARDLERRATTPGDANKAADLLRAALAQDSTFTLAWALLADVLITVMVHGERLNDQDLVAEARQAADRALALGPQIPEVQTVIGDITFNIDWNWQAAFQARRKAYEANPADPDSCNRFANALFLLGGDDPRVIELHKKAIALDPLDVSNYGRLAEKYYYINRLPEAEVAARKVVASSPEGWGVHRALGDILISEGRANDALLEYRKEAYPGHHRRGDAIAYFALGRHAEADRALAEFERNDALQFSYSIAAVHARRGETDLAFRWLERAYSQHDSYLPYVHRDPWFAGLHADPRWPDFLRKMRLPELPSRTSS
jgi:serine/threonine protein kinase/TolB-like protein